MGFKFRHDYLRKSPKLIDYATYLTKHENQEFSAFHQIQAENMHYKNSSTIIQGTSRDVGVEPFSLLKLKLNVVGVDSYHVPGNSATWIANFEKAGFYQITVKALQSRQNTTSYRIISMGKFLSKKQTFRSLTEINGKTSHYQVSIKTISFLP